MGIRFHQHILKQVSWKIIDAVWEFRVCGRILKSCNGTLYTQ